ncbi:LCP family protein [Propioniciclava coleopterorum]|uniref:LCP family protein n=1 Tax=Propioniciclava coleopterorum TaxID=2714937 RepID=A0A6G7Y3Z6_9ACTN|nr:LCP family protein [Propioniciclava coleopterorum]QIK71337.1 LCP family protein [Propioniciclava coleopterorum]
MNQVTHADAAQQSRRIAWRRGVGLLVMTALAPGSAQLVAGGRGVGRFAMRVWGGVLLLLAAFVATVLLNRNLAVALFTHPATQWIASVVVLALGLGWALLFLDAWRISHPRAMGGRQLGMAGLSLVLAAAVGLGATQASALSRSQAQLFGNVFAGGGETQAKDGRINVLLIGADAGDDRQGLRADTIMVASVSATTGRTVLFSLPRNLQHAPFPRGSQLAKQYPGGYACPDQSCLLNAVYQLGHQHKADFPDAADPGIAATRAVVGETLGLGINYYALVDMRGFESLIDALGGVKLDIAKAVPIGGGAARVEGYIQPGKGVTLDGFQALWFARSREGSSDYERMTRQKCVMNALVKQVNPVTVATNFTSLADAGGAMVSTDIPGSEVAPLLELANAGRRLPLASTAFAPPLIEPSRPDYDLIRRTVAGEIAHSETLDVEAQRQAEAAPTAPAAPTPDAAPASGPKPSSAAPAASATAAAPSGQKKGSAATPAGEATPKPVVGKKAEKSDGHFSEERQTADLETVCGVA